jgi:hypothetical protein
VGENLAHFFNERKAEGVNNSQFVMVEETLIHRKDVQVKGKRKEGRI